MGLDMDLYRVKQVIKQSDVFEIKNDELIDVMSWRKFRTLQSFMNQLWETYSTPRTIEPNEEDLVITQEMLEQMVQFLSEAEFGELKEYPNLEKWNSDVQRTLECFKSLLTDFNFDQETLIYSCSY